MSGKLAKLTQQGTWAGFSSRLLWPQHACSFYHRKQPPEHFHKVIEVNSSNEDNVQTRPLCCQSCSAEMDGNSTLGLSCTKLQGHCGKLYKLTSAHGLRPPRQPSWSAGYREIGKESQAWLGWVPCLRVFHKTEDKLLTKAVVPTECCNRKGTFPGLHDYQ